MNRKIERHAGVVRFVPYDTTSGRTPTQSKEEFKAAAADSIGRIVSVLPMHTCYMHLHNITAPQCTKMHRLLATSRHTRQHHTIHTTLCTTMHPLPSSSFHDNHVTGRFNLALLQITNSTYTKVLPLPTLSLTLFVASCSNYARRSNKAGALRYY